MGTQYEKFKQKAKKFLDDKGHFDDENSCKRIVDFILDKDSIIKEVENKFLIAFQPAVENDFKLFHHSPIISLNVI